MEGSNGAETSAERGTPESSAEKTSAISSPRGASIRITGVGKPEVLITLDGVPGALREMIDGSRSPASFWTSLFKDVVPGFTSLAAVLISLAALVYTSRQKSTAEHLAQQQQQEANKAATKKLSAGIIGEFGNKLPPEDVVNQLGNVSSTDQKIKEIKDFERKYELAAMKFAIYGEQALPALRMALGSEDRGLQQGGILVAEEMYRAESIDHRALTNNILGFFKTTSPTLQRGVLDWVLEMDSQLSPDEGRMTYEAIKTNFGENAELCLSQNEAVAVRAANFLNRRAFPDSKSLLVGIVTHCREETLPNQFIGARDSAVQALQRVAQSLSREQCDVLLNQDLPKLKDLSDLIDGASKRIQTICASK